MKMLKLKKQNEPDFGELSRMIGDLGEFLDEILTLKTRSGEKT